MRVLLLSRYGPSGASSRVRSYQYLPMLRSAGVEVDVNAFFSDRYVENLYAGGRASLVDLARSFGRRLANLRACGSYDLIWLEKEALPFLPGWFERLLLRGDVPVAVDLDDAVFHRYDGHPSRLVRAVLGKKLDRIFGACACVLAGNEYLAARARAAGAVRVEIVPTAVDLERYLVREPGAPALTCTIGWIGTPGTSPYLRAIGGALAEVCRDPNTTVRLIGARLGDLDYLRVDHRPWSEATEVADLQTLDAGIMPLPDLPFERGKCGYKLIQYMAVGLPVVASPVGANCAIVRHGVSGYLAQTPAEWAAALKALRSLPELRRSMGSAGRRIVEERYALQLTAPRLLSILRDVGSAPTGNPSVSP